MWLGTVVAGSQFRLVDDDGELNILADQAGDHGYTFLCLPLATPLMPGEARWFRWRIVPYSTSMRPSSIWRRAWKYLVDELDDEFSIRSPVDVRKRFVDDIECMKEVGTHGHKARVWRTCDRLLRSLNNEDSCVEMVDWSIVLIPGRRQLAITASAKGIADQTGPASPQYYGPHTAERCYRWASGSVNIPDASGTEDCAFDFDIYAKTHLPFVVSRGTMRLLGTIGGIVVVAALLWEFVVAALFAWIAALIR